MLLAKDEIWYLEIIFEEKSFSGISFDLQAALDRRRKGRKLKIKWKINTFVQSIFSDGAKLRRKKIGN